MERCEAGELVARCASLASLLEVSAYPKPGNVHRIRDLPTTRYEHFLAGSVAIIPSIRNLALKGYDASQNSVWSSIELGKYLLEAVEDTLQWQQGGNVNLGVSLLFSPIAVASGSLLAIQDTVDVYKLREALKKVIRSTTWEDSIAVYKAISLAMTPENLGQVEELDVLDESSLLQIREEELTLLDVFAKCEIRDSICREWVTDFEITFSTGYPYLKMVLEKLGDINYAIVDTYLLILSLYPDSLIQRKAGVEKALEVSDWASRILEGGGSSTDDGFELLWALDEKLHQAKGDLNPGTTADLTAASILVLLIEGWRP